MSSWTKRASMQWVGLLWRWRRDENNGDNSDISASAVGAAHPLAYSKTLVGCKLALLLFTSTAVHASNFLLLITAIFFVRPDENSLIRSCPTKYDYCTKWRGNMPMFLWSIAFFQLSPSDERFTPWLTQWTTDLLIYAWEDKKAILNRIKSTTYWRKRCLMRFLPL